MKSTAEMTAAPEMIFTGRMLATSKSHGGLLIHWGAFLPIHDDDEEREALRDKGLTLTIPSTLTSRPMPNLDARRARKKRRREVSSLAWQTVSLQSAAAGVGCCCGLELSR
jgi:hypothetical protein